MPQSARLRPLHAFTLALAMVTSFFTGAPSVRAQSLDVPLTVHERSNVARRNTVVTSGVPLPAGLRHDPTKLVVVDDANRPLPTQVSVISRWWKPAHDGSLRWVRVSFPCDVAAGANATYRLVDRASLGDAASRAASGAANPEDVVVQETAEHFAITTGTAEFIVPRTGGLLLKKARVGGSDLIGGGMGLIAIGADWPEMGMKAGGLYAAESRSVVIEERGPVRAVIRIDGAFVGKGEGVFKGDLYRCRTRLYFERGSATMRIVTSVKNSHLADDVYTWPLRDVSLLTQIEPGEAPRALFLGERKTTAVDLHRWKGGTLHQNSSGGEQWRNLTKKKNYARWLAKYTKGETVRGVSFRGYRLSTPAGVLDQGSQAGGVVDVSGRRGGLTIAQRNFRVRYPGTLAASRSSVRVGLWPGEFSEPLFLAPGQRITRELTIAFRGPGAPTPDLPAANRALDRRLLFLAPAQWYVASGGWDGGLSRWRGAVSSRRATPPRNAPARTPKKTSQQARQQTNQQAPQRIAAGKTPRAPQASEPIAGGESGSAGAPEAGEGGDNERLPPPWRKRKSTRIVPLPGPVAHPSQLAKGLPSRNGVPPAAGAPTATNNPALIPGAIPGRIPGTIPGLTPGTLRGNAPGNTPGAAGDGDIPGAPPRSVPDNAPAASPAVLAALRGAGNGGAARPGGPIARAAPAPARSRLAGGYDKASLDGIDVGWDWYGWINGYNAGGGHWNQTTCFAETVLNGDLAAFDRAEARALWAADTALMHYDPTNLDRYWLKIRGYYWRDVGIQYHKWPGWYDRAQWREPDAGHMGMFMWFEYYNLTGDRRVLDACLALGQKARSHLWKNNHDDVNGAGRRGNKVPWCRKRDPNDETFRLHHRATGWPFYDLTLLYQLTGDEQVLRESANIAAGFRNTMQWSPFGFLTTHWNKPGSKDMYGGQQVSGPPRTDSGSMLFAHFHAGIIMTALVQFHRETLDEDALDTLIGCADFYTHQVMLKDAQGRMHGWSYVFGDYWGPYSLDEFDGRWRPNWLNQNFRIVQPLGWVYMLTGREDYRKVLETALSKLRGPGKKVMAAVQALQVERPDRVPPAAITDLAATVEGGRVQLQWTAPGDDGTVGTATRYQVKYSTSPIVERVKGWPDRTPPLPQTLAAWEARASAFRAKQRAFWAVENVGGEPRPAAAGASQSFALSLPTGTYYLAVKTWDEAPNMSGLSNVVRVTVGG